MKLRIKYLLFLGILHLVVLVLCWLLFEKNRVWFMVSESLVLVSAIIAWRLYRQLARPLAFLMRGVDAIRERDFNVKFQPTGQHELDKLISVYNNMIDELRKERVKQEQQHFFLEKLIQTSPTGIIILDYEDVVQQANPKALQVLGTSENMVCRKSIGELQHPVWREIAALQSGKSQTITLDGISTYKIQKSHFIDRGFPRHFIMLEELTEEILAAEKKAYGKVIRMMAHEVNNTIGPVNSILQSVQHSPCIPREGLLMDSLQVAIDRNYNLNTFMRNFADVVRLPTAHPVPLSLNRLLEHTCMLLQPAANMQHTTLQLQIISGEMQVPADQQLLEQALINIIKNSLEAVAREGKVVVTLDAAQRRLTVTDNGKGISDAVAAQLFTPFFSNKKDGQGIGLTLVKEILLQHGFAFSLKTVAPGETVFTIDL
ncbi:PAS domain-containing protein [Chitinophaga jiangningensis]|uniref:histidine kinase n=1 Tax=Chitinophaga jiangningensis TaxID=1419482 RepID=A0A1M7LU53_9BACT|nr:ATP-binding protein [Chitinophaga jiangningensis]SHM81724.1 PAS domain-containing protein [Chitinophaga jiangningensis]